MAVTIKDVAREAGIAVSTVSKAMNGEQGVSAETRRKVREVIERLDYHPNVRAQNFVRRSSRTILFLTALERGIGFSNPHLFEIIAGVEAALRHKGYTMVLQGVTPEEACNIVRMAAIQQMADGVVLHASILSKELDILISDLALPHIAIGYPSFPNHFSWIDSDNSLAGEMAARHLVTQGHRRIAFIGGWEEDQISTHRLEGVRKELSVHGITLTQDLLRHGDSTCDCGYELTVKLLSGERKPDAIICANNYIAYGCFQATRDKKVDIPKDVALLTFDDFPFSRVLHPMLSCVTIDVYDMGFQAGKHILAMIQKPNLRVQTYTTLPILIARASTETDTSETREALIKFSRVD